MAWKKGRKRQLVNRRVPDRQLSSFWNHLQEEGVWMKPTASGFQFYAGQYKISVRALAEGNSVSENAVRRLAHWLLQGNGDFEWE